MPRDDESPRRTGRRVQQDVTNYGAQGVDPEPLTYLTQGRPQVPSYDGSFGSSPLSSSPLSSSAPEAGLSESSVLHQAPPPEGQPSSYRVRDFSPEGSRRAALGREGGSHAALPDRAPSVDLDYQTHGAPLPSVPPVPMVSVIDDLISEHTLTRRELREIRAAAEAQSPQLRLSEPIETILNSGPIELASLVVSAPIPAPSAPVTAPTEPARTLADALAEFDLLARGHDEPEQAVAKPTIPWQAPTPWQPPIASLQPPASVNPEPEPDLAASRPVGHWSVQAQQDDEPTFEDTIGRRIGGGAAPITTSSLVLPSVPQAGITSPFSPFSSTGEILVTGSIELPRSLGSTGAHPHRIDNSDFEEDLHDIEVGSTDSAPVRAIRAVSTHTSTRGVIETKRPQSNRPITAMIIAASVLVVAVVGLLVVIVVHGF